MSERSKLARALSEVHQHASKLATDARGEASPGWGLVAAGLERGNDLHRTLNLAAEIVAAQRRIVEHGLRLAGGAPSQPNLDREEATACRLVARATGQRPALHLAWSRDQPHSVVPGGGVGATIDAEALAGAVDQQSLHRLLRELSVLLSNPSPELANPQAQGRQDPDPIAGWQSQRAGVAPGQPQSVSPGSPVPRAPSPRPTDRVRPGTRRTAAMRYGTGRRHQILRILALATVIATASITSVGLFWVASNTQTRNQPDRLVAERRDANPAARRAVGTGATDLGRANSAGSVLKPARHRTDSFADRLAHPQASHPDNPTNSTPDHLRHVAPAPPIPNAGSDGRLPATATDRSERQTSGFTASAVAGLRSAGTGQPESRELDSAPPPPGVGSDPDPAAINATDQPPPASRSNTTSAGPRPTPNVPGPRRDPTRSQAATVKPPAARYAPALLRSKNPAAALQLFEALKQRHVAALTNKSAELRRTSVAGDDTWYQVVVVPAGTKTAAETCCRELGPEGRALGCSVTLY